MNKQEHELMMTMFGIQFAMFTALVNTLKAKGVLTDTDIGALDRAPHLPPEKAEELKSIMRVQYIALAKLIGFDPEEAS